MIRSTFIFLFAFISFKAFCQPSNPAPTRQQSRWQDMEFYLFTHFGPNTFTNKEWGHGNEPENVFNPVNLDCEQWCRIAKAAGAKGIIITAKHHDGFCLWPSKYSTHTVRESKWKNGKGDVLKELSQACKKYGLKFGVYLSPWDRNHPDYGTPAYNDVFVNMMKEIFQPYGPIWEFWWDGANGEGLNGKKQEYDWKRFESAIKNLSPNTIVFSDIGPDIRWVGNEKGIAGETNWNLLDTTGFHRGIGAPPNDTLQQGNRNGRKWIPAECDVSIRPGWFYHEEENTKVKSPETLFGLYLKSVGRGANLLLNVPPDNRGLIHETDSAALMDFQKLRKENFHNNLTSTAREFNLHASANIKSRVVLFSRSQNINCIVLKENLSGGQRVGAFSLILQDEKNQAIKVIRGTTIGHKRILTFPTINVKKIILQIDDQKDPAIISDISAYLIAEKLVEKEN